MTYREFLSRHSSRELTQILGRNRIDPYDLAGRIELAVAKLCAMFFNVNRGPMQDARSADDYLPKWGQVLIDEVNQPSPEELLASAKVCFGIK